MKILFLHEGILPVKTYGGTERILYWLMKGLIKKGHEVILIGHPKSEVERDGIKLIPNNQAKDWRMLVPEDIDLIHLQCPKDEEIEQKFVLTVHGNGIPGEIYPENSIFVSKKHASIHGSESYVYNSLDLNEYPYRERQRKAWSDFLFLARVSWKVKNVKDCIKACKKVGKNLHIAGGRKFSFSSLIKSYGMIGQIEKNQLLDRVDALLWPVRWHEPFGIAVIEAYSAGVPVIASPYGSLKELITEETGILCDNFESFKEAISRKENTFDPKAIRNVLETKYSVDVMVDNYIRCYERVINGEQLNPEKPRYLGHKHPETLLDF